ncbi:ArnT family glycosyltransferase [Desulfobotulus mexicanus]|uniref:Phospholipid carrier-dependent glycosyltransferase n=1 Tax=Desulfobotulus mexicanus TaxID=2586642 RepID=A0A5Q4VG10_9BACT|nr:glycosyltransferase family 39 protein [Desulfobotulus mexicanus]TYT75826.1 phospholipid carrier-dependent glycosyltransferase [Desulfobotulus mexicanus]
MNLGNRIQPIHYLLFFLILLTIIFISILAAVPPVDRDALTHHLIIPKLYLEHGFHEIPHIIFSYYPMNLNLLYMIPMYFGNDILPKYIHFLFAILTAVLIYKYLSQRTNKSYGLLGALFFLSTPVVIRLSSTVYVDLGLVFFFFASILAIFRWIETGFKTRYLIISGIFCGLALGTKYNALVGFFLLTLFIPFIYVRYNQRSRNYHVKSIAAGTLFVFVALAVFSPWMVRNVVWTGNPIYPLYNSIFISKPEPEKSEIKKNTPAQKKPLKITHIDVRHHLYEESWLEIALIPVRVFFQGEDDNPKYFDGRLNPFIFLLSLFAFMGISAAGRQKNTEKWILLSFSVLFLLYACAKASIRIRYFIPILPPMIVLSMYGLYNIENRFLNRQHPYAGCLRKTVMLTIAFAMLGMNVLYMKERFEKDRPLPYITGKISRDDYIQQYRPEYAALQYANANLGEGHRILGLYLGNRHYYSDIPIEFSTHIFRSHAKNADSGTDLAIKLHEKGLSHILVRLSMLNDFFDEYNEQEQKILKAFFEKNAVMEFHKDGNGLLRILIPAKDDDPQI